MKHNIDYSLYLVTDRELMTTSCVEDSVEQAIRGGATVVQLREKSVSGRPFYETALRVKRVTQRHGIPLVINDRVDVALAIDAEGVHVGQDDLPASVVRQLIGPERLLGVSASNREEALLACRAGADYLGVGAMFGTGTKPDAGITSLEELRRIRERVDLPIVVIGGIREDTVAHFAGTGIDGLAVVSAIVAQPDIEAATRKLKTLFLQACKL